MDNDGAAPMCLLEDFTVNESDQDIKPVLEVCGADEGLCEALLDASRDVLDVVAELGGNVKKYRRERARAMRRLVAEVYSAPRVTQMLKHMPGLGLVPGFALDLTTVDTDGRSWDFTDSEMRERARRKVREEKPFILIGRDRKSVV